MKLSTLHKATARALLEGFDSTAVQQNLSLLQRMITSQGKDPEAVLRRIKGSINPKILGDAGGGMKAIYSERVKNFVSSAQAGQFVDGVSHGRKVRLTVLEYILREGYWSSIGRAILGKLRQDIEMGGDDEHELTAKAIDEFPVLAWILRYARRAEADLMQDETFWQKLDQTTGGLGQKVREMADAVIPMMREMREKNPNAGLLSEMLVIERKLSDVMVGAGLDQMTAKQIMGEFGLRDDEFTEPANAGAAAAPAEASAETAPVEAAPGGAPTGASAAGAAQAPAAQKPMSSAEYQRLQHDNWKIANSIAVIAAYTMKAAKGSGAAPGAEAGAEAGAPEESPADATPPTGPTGLSPQQYLESINDPSVVSARDLLR